MHRLPHRWRVSALPRPVTDRLAPPSTTGPGAAPEAGTRRVVAADGMPRLGRQGDGGAHARHGRVRRFGAREHGGVRRRSSVIGCSARGVAGSRNGAVVRGRRIPGATTVSLVGRLAELLRPVPRCCLQVPPAYHTATSVVLTRCARCQRGVGSGVDAWKLCMSISGASASISGCDCIQTWMLTRGR